MTKVLNQDLAWIRDGTTREMSIRSAIPDGFEVYGLLDINEEEHPTEDVLLAALGYSANETLVAGWIVRGSWMIEPGDEHRLYSNWRYRCRHVTGADLLGRPTEGDDAFPDLLYPRDHRWVVSRLWDDSWRSIGATAAQAREITRLLPAFEQIASDTDISTTGREVR